MINYNLSLLFSSKEKQLEINLQTLKIVDENFNIIHFTTFSLQLSV